MKYRPENIWDALAAHQGEQFNTIKGLPFTYYLKGGECFIDRRKKSITRSTFEKAYQRIAEDTDGQIGGPKQLNVFGAPYVWAIFMRLGIVEKTD